MSVTIELPAAYRRHALGQRQVQLDGPGPLNELLGQLCERFAGLKPQLLTEDGRLYGSVAVFVNGVDMRRLEGLQTPLRSGDVLSLVPAISGG